MACKCGNIPSAFVTIQTYIVDTYQWQPVTAPAEVDVIGITIQNNSANAGVLIGLADIPWPVGTGNPPNTFNVENKGVATVNNVFSINTFGQGIIRQTLYIAGDVSGNIANVTVLLTCLQKCKC